MHKKQQHWFNLFNIALTPFLLAINYEELFIVLQETDLQISPIGQGTIIPDLEITPLQVADFGNCVSLANNRRV